MVRTPEAKPPLRKVLVSPDNALTVTPVDFGGVTGYNVSYELRDAAVPARRFPADGVRLQKLDYDLRFLFTQRGYPGPRLRAMVDIAMSSADVRLFVDTLPLFASQLRKYASTYDIRALSPADADAPAEQNANFRANLVAAAQTRHDVVLDFYEVETREVSWMLQELKAGKSYDRRPPALEAVVRVQCHISVMLSLLDQIEAAASGLPSSEIPG